MLFLTRILSGRSEGSLAAVVGIELPRLIHDVLRSEPGVIEAFEKVYGTKDLLVSFDAVNVTFPK
jgi:hypothetical protein